MSYMVKANGAVMPEQYTTETAAIEAAEQMTADGYECSVVLVSRSGTEKSQMQVWPTSGQMYSQHR